MSQVETRQEKSSAQVQMDLEPDLLLQRQRPASDGEMSGRQ